MDIIGWGNKLYDNWKEEELLGEYKNMFEVQNFKWVKWQKLSNPDRKNGISKKARCKELWVYIRNDMSQTVDHRLH